MNKQTMLITSLQGQRGMALVSALLLLLVISLLAIGLSMDSSMDVRGAAYQNLKARAFDYTDAGLYVASDILEENAFVGGWTNPSPPDAFTFPSLSDQYDDITPGTIDIFQDGAFYMDKNLARNPIIVMTGDIEAEVMTQYLTSELAYGGAIQVAAGYGGSGKGVGGGGGHILYNIESIGRDGAFAAQQASTVLGLNYRYVTK